MQFLYGLKLHNHVLFSSDGCVLEDIGLYYRVTEK